jgi:hypothetical protein
VVEVGFILLAFVPGLFLDCIGDLLGILLLVIPAVFVFRGLSFEESTLHTAGEFSPGADLVRVIPFKVCLGEGAVVFPELGGVVSLGISSGNNNNNKINQN